MQCHRVLAGGHTLVMVFALSLLMITAVSVDAMSMPYGSSVELLVTLNERFWQHQVEDILQSNITSDEKFQVHYVRRHSMASRAFQTDFGLVNVRFKYRDRSQLSVQDVIDEYKQRLGAYVSFVKAVQAYESMHPRRRQILHSYAHTQGRLQHRKGYRHMTLLAGNAKGRERFIAGKAETEFRAHSVLGKGIKVGVFDTGLNDNHPHFPNLRLRMNFTEESDFSDKVGHGSFVAGVMCGHSEQCPGLAPESDLYVFRSFTADQRSYTSWFLDAFNYAIWLEIDVINLSIGGPDHKDIPFIDKINEASANGIVIVSAIGNDGPIWGTIFSPSDLPNLIGVGGYEGNGKVSAFSARGECTLFHTSIHMYLYT